MPKQPSNTRKFLSEIPPNKYTERMLAYSVFEYGLDSALANRWRKSLERKNATGATLWASLGHTDGEPLKIEAPGPLKED